VGISAEAAITNLLYRYGEAIDAGRFEELATGLFARCRFVVAPPPASAIDATAMVDLLCRTTIRYEDGTPHTKHVITNPIVELGEDQTTATCRSVYVVYQRTAMVPLQPIVAGRYHDRFCLVDGEWCFTERDYTLVDLVGDVRDHLRGALPAQP
jgi:3-phenylpropionate/cinnamic acid dioxygenase small subunit